MTFITLELLCILPRITILVASEATVVSKWPQRPHNKVEISKLFYPGINVKCHNRKLTLAELSTIAAQNERALHQPSVNRS